MAFAPQPGGAYPGMANEILVPFHNMFSQTYSAADFPGATNEAKIDNMLAAAILSKVKYGYVPANMLPYNASLVTNLAAFGAAGGRMIREGGDPSVYDVQAYGAAGDGTTDDTTAIQSAITAAGANANT